MKRLTDRLAELEIYGETSAEVGARFVGPGAGIRRASALSHKPGGELTNALRLPDSLEGRLDSFLFSLCNAAIETIT